MTSATLTSNGGAGKVTRQTEMPFVAVGAPRVLPALQRRLRHSRNHRILTATLDAAIIAAAAGATAVVQMTLSSTSKLAICAGCIVLAATWIIALLSMTRPSRRGLTQTTTAIVPTVHSALIAIAVVAVTAGIAGWPILRLHLVITLPAALLALVMARLWQRLRQTRTSDLAPRVVVMGGRGDVENAIRALNGGRAKPTIVGAVLGDGTTGELLIDGTHYPVLGASAQIVAIARTLCIETVVEASASDSPDHVRRLSWSLEGSAMSLVLATPLTDVAHSRVSFGHTTGLALTRVNLPRFDDSAMRSKRLLDVVVATLALIPIAVVLPFIAAVITLESRGGVFFRQRRIGRDGSEFEILKFRTMRTTAEAELDALALQNEGSGPLFKLKRDPRVTRVGAVLRRFSLDELPQFWNVLRGDMSVVGPRPPLPIEVYEYESTVMRRLYVQPGITGLWQTSGRSDLTWEQSVRLDLHYVENWSVATDLRIMCRTAAAMVRPKGAY